MVPGYEAKRESMLKIGLLNSDASEPGNLRLREDHVFRSPREAASVMNASSENGRSRWVTEQGTSCGVWQAQSLKPVAAGSVPHEDVAPDAAGRSSSS